MKALGVLLFILGNLGGCMLGPDYRETPPAVPAHWQAGQDASAELKAVDPQMLKDWWKSFDDTGLDRLMKQALAGNLDLKIALTRIDQARAERSGTRAELFPKVNLGIGAARYENPLPGLVPGTRFNFFQLGFDTLWEIDLFGRQRRRLEAASADLDAADEQYRFALVTLTAEVARSYIEYRNLQNQQIITRANLTAQQQILSLTETLFREGVGTRFEVVRARALTETTTAQLPALEARQTLKQRSSNGAPALRGTIKVVTIAYRINTWHSLIAVSYE